jgi:hypothetical protein
MYWQVHKFGLIYIAYAYDEYGYTGAWGYVSGYGQIPKLICRNAS